MLDIKFIRENKDIVAQGAKKKHVVFDVEELIKIDDERRNLLASIEKKRAEQNTVSEKIAASTTSVEERTAMIEEMKTLKKTVEKEDADLKEVMKKWQLLMLQVPNVPDMSVPDGDSDAENKDVTRVLFPSQRSCRAHDGSQYGGF